MLPAAWSPGRLVAWSPGRLAAGRLAAWPRGRWQRGSCGLPTTGGQTPFCIVLYAYTPLYKLLFVGHVDNSFLRIHMTHKPGASVRDACVMRA